VVWGLEFKNSILVMKWCILAVICGLLCLLVCSTLSYICCSFAVSYKIIKSYTYLLLPVYILLEGGGAKSLFLYYKLIYNDNENIKIDCSLNDSISEVLNCQINSMLIAGNAKRIMCQVMAKQRSPVVVIRHRNTNTK